MFEGCGVFGLTQLVAMWINLDLTALDDNAPISFLPYLLVR